VGNPCSATCQEDVPYAAQLQVALQLPQPILVEDREPRKRVFIEICHNDYGLLKDDGETAIIFHYTTTLINYIPAIHLVSFPYLFINCHVL